LRQEFGQVGGALRAGITCCDFCSRPSGAILNRRAVPALVFVAVALLALGLPVVAPPVPDGADEAALVCVEDEPLLFAMSIADETGETLAEPKLVGLCGVPLELRLSEPFGGSERMSLQLQPDAGADGAFEIAFSLSVPGKLHDGRGTLRLRPGEERKATISYPGGHLDVQLVAFSMRSHEARLYLEQGAALGTPGRT